MAQPDPVYDQENDQPDLKALEEAKKSSEPTDNSAEPETEKLNEHENQVGGGYKKQAKDNVSGLRRVFGRGRRKYFVGGGIGAGITVAILAAIFALLPLKILHIGENLEKRFFATSEQAVGDEVETLFSNWITTKVLPGLNGTCSSTKIDRSCVQKADGNNPFAKLYNGWKDARLENKLYTKYGIEFAKVGDNYYLSAPDLDQKVDINKFVNKNGNMFAQLNRTQFRAYLQQSLNEQTRWGRILYYAKVGPLIEKKYGIRRCVAAKPCGLLDALDNKNANTKLFFKAWLAEHILAPQNEMLSLAVQCAISDSCNDTVLNNSEEGPNGQRESKFEKDLQAKLAAFAALYGATKMDDLLKLSKEIQDQGFGKYVTQKILKELVGDKASELASKVVPIIGWANFADSLVYNTTSLAPALKKMNYVINSTSMIALFSLYRTYGDEIKAGDINAAITGGFTNSLGPGAKSDGSGAEAEAAPLYSALLGSQAKTTTSFLNSIQPQAYAATTNTTAYMCDNGKQVPSGKLVCSEENLGSDSAAIAALNKITDVIPGPVKTFADFWHNVVKKILGPLLDALGKGLGYLFGPIISQISGYFADMIQPLISFMTSQLINQPITDNMSGARSFDMIAGGADAAGNDYAHNALGGVQLSNQQLSSILYDQQQQDLSNYQHQSFFARMFDTQSRYSPISKLAISMPSSMDSLHSQFASFISNPFRNLGALFNLSHADAAAAAKDPFGITQYGYPANDPELAKANQDPEKYWTENCSTDGLTIDQTKITNANYRKNTLINADTQMPENTSDSSGTDPCYLLQAAFGAAGALFDSSLLTSDDFSGATSDQTNTNADTQCPQLTEYQLNVAECKWAEYIKQNVASLLPANQADIAARGTWWSLKEGEFDLDNPFGYSNCGTGNGNTPIDFLATCPASTWQVGIASVQVPNFTDAQVDAEVKARHPGTDIKTILGQVAQLAGFQQGSKEYQGAVNSTGILRRSLLLRDPATGFSLVYGDIAPCINSWQSWCGPVGGAADAVAANQQTAKTVIQELSSYFRSSTQ